MISWLAEARAWSLISCAFRRVTRQGASIAIGKFGERLCLPNDEGFGEYDLVSIKMQIKIFSFADAVVLIFDSFSEIQLRPKISFAMKDALSIKCVALACARVGI
jgi:hypothetical protein